MTFSPKISVVLSSKNGMPFLPEAVDSILYQTFTNFELLLLDDGSTDDTRSYMETIHDHRVKCIYNEHNLGIDGSRNKAFVLANAPYIAPMDADDFALAERLAIQYDFMEQNLNILASGGNISIYETNEVWTYPSEPGYTSFWTLFNSPIAHPASIFRKQETYNITHGYPPNLSPSEDYGLWALLLMSGRENLANIKKQLLRYRTHPGRDRGNYHQVMRNQADKVRAQLCKWFWGNEYDENKLPVHLLITYNQPKSIEEVRSVISYLYAMTSRNSRSNFLPYNEFVDNVCRQWAQYCQEIPKKVLFQTLLRLPQLFLGVDLHLTFKMQKIFLYTFFRRTKAFCQRRLFAIQDHCEN